MNQQERVERLQKMVDEGNVLRGKWVEGEARACLLAALSPEAGEQKTASACPASVMPEWLAFLTTYMDDEGSDGEWPSFVKRYAKLAARWHVLSPEDWRRADHAVRAMVVREAAKHTSDAGALAVCETIATLNERAASGEEVGESEWREASAAAACAAYEAWSATASRAASAAGRVANAAQNAAWSAESAAVSAENAARSAVSVVSAAWSAAWSEANATWSEANAARSASWDRINDGVLGIIEAACLGAEEAAR